MLKRNFVIAFVLSVLLASHSLCAESEKSKTFSQHKCKVTLPGKKSKWFDHKLIPSGFAGYIDKSGTLVYFFAMDSSKNITIDDAFVDSFEKSFLAQADYRKIWNRSFEFKGVPCFELRAALGKEGSVITDRVFVANGLCYQIQTLEQAAKPVTVAERETLFNAFAFTEEPEKHVGRGILLKIFSPGIIGGIVGAMVAVFYRMRKKK